MKRKNNRKLFNLLSHFLFFSGYIICGFDNRFGWSNIPIDIIILADIIILLGYLLVFFVFKQNRYASRVVEVEQNQKVISAGLYAYVRHPMYIGIIIMFVSTPIRPRFILGSYFYGYNSFSISSKNYKWRKSVTKRVTWLYWILSKKGFRQLVSFLSQTITKGPDLTHVDVSVHWNKQRL